MAETVLPGSALGMRVRRAEVATEINRAILAEEQAHDFRVKCLQERSWSFVGPGVRRARSRARSCHTRLPHPAGRDASPAISDAISDRRMVTAERDFNPRGTAPRGHGEEEEEGGRRTPLAPLPGWFFVRADARQLWRRHLSLVIPASLRLPAAAACHPLFQQWIVLSPSTGVRVDASDSYRDEAPRGAASPPRGRVLVLDSNVSCRRGARREELPLLAS